MGLETLPRRMPDYNSNSLVAKKASSSCVQFVEKERDTSLALQCTFPFSLGLR